MTMDQREENAQAAGGVQAAEDARDAQAADEVGGDGAEQPVTIAQVLDPEGQVELDRQIPVYERYLAELTEELNTEPDYHFAPRPGPPHAG